MSFFVYTFKTMSGKLRRQARRVKPEWVDNEEGSAFDPSWTDDNGNFVSCGRPTYVDPRARDALDFNFLQEHGRPAYVGSEARDALDLSEDEICVSCDGRPTYSNSKGRDTLDFIEDEIRASCAGLPKYNDPKTRDTLDFNFFEEYGRPTYVDPKLRNAEDMGEFETSVSCDGRPARDHSKVRDTLDLFEMRMASPRLAFKASKVRDALDFDLFDEYCRPTYVDPKARDALDLFGDDIWVPSNGRLSDEAFEFGIASASSHGEQMRPLAFYPSTRKSR
jgi:hypothetical protein